MAESEERSEQKIPDEDTDAAGTASADEAKPRPGKRGAESGGPKGLEPTRYGDWERKGRCIDF
ncbi:MAG: DUF1674 domain-containing protein [Rhodospirillales bacterium]|jgi:hypothetical protein|nr:DUF1674 domain-containing protein [Rhodospirillales bacterium]